MPNSQHTANRRDPKTEALWFTVTIETHDDLGVPFNPSRGPIAAVRHHGGIIAYYSGYNGTEREARQAAHLSIVDRVNVLCGIAA
jgi:hypothetical protein